MYMPCIRLYNINKGLVTLHELILLETAHDTLILTKNFHL